MLASILQPSIERLPGKSTASGMKACGARLPSEALEQPTG